jgi:hypothetical protein
MTTLKKIDRFSAEGIENSLAIFDLPPTNVAINRTQTRELLPLSALNDTGPYTFRLFADNQFPDLSRTWLYLATRIEKKINDDWVPIGVTDDDKHIGVVQNFGHSFVRQMTVNISNVEVFNSGVHYAYRAYMLNELGYSNETRRGLHEAGCYYPDDLDQNDDNNKGFKGRAARFAAGQTCETMVKLNFDLANQDLLMLSNSDIIITIHRNTDDFLLLSPYYDKKTQTTDPTTGVVTTGTANVSAANHSPYRIKILDMRLYVKTVDVTQSLNNAISKHLESTPAKYPLRRIETRSIFVGKGRTELSWNCFTNVVPRRLIIGFISNDAYSGRKSLSPFVFEHANIRSICAEASGYTYPNIAYNLDFSENKFIRAFTDLYSGLGLDKSDRTISLSMVKYMKSHCFFLIPMTSTLEDSSGFETIKNSTTCIKVIFNNPIKDEGYEMIVLGEFDGIISVDKDRIITSDGQV